MATQRAKVRRTAANPQWWVYKCNKDKKPYLLHRDWNYFFSLGRQQEWGSTEWAADMHKLRPGDLIIAYQTDRNELVGIAIVVRLRRRKSFHDVVLRPLMPLNGKVRALKRKSQSVARIAAFNRGPKNTLNPVTPDEAKTLLMAVEAADALTFVPALDGRVA